MSIAKQEFTNAGRSMLGRAQNAEILHITKIVAGSGAASQPSDLWPLTALKVPEMDVVISSARDLGDGVMIVEGNFRSDQAPRAFYLREVGIMAHIGAEADALYSVANVFADPPDYIDPVALTVQVFKIKLIVDRIPTGQLDVSIGPSEAVMGENIGADTVGPGPYKETMGNVLRFKRIIQGAAMDIHEVPGPNGDAIYIGTSVLKNDLDLYVPANHPDCPDPSVGFPSIQAAHDHLLAYFIPAENFARIHVWKGTFAKANFRHPNSLQISLHGAPRVDKHIQVINWLDNTPTPQAPIDTVNVGGSSGHKNLAIPGDVSDLSVGQIVYLTGCNWGWTGGCKITAKAGNIITCDVPDQSNQTQHYVTQSSEVNFPNQRLSYYPTIVQWVNPQPGVRPQEHCLAFPYGIRLVENFLVIGARNAFGAQADMGLNNVMAWGAIAGCGSFTGLCMTSGDYVATHCEYGSGGPGMLWHIDVAMINGCLNGMFPGYNGCAFAAINSACTTWWLYITHCNIGIRMGLNCSAYGSHYLYGLNDYGVYSDMAGILNLASGLENFPFQNTTKDLVAKRMSYILYNRGGMPAPTCDPPTNPGNQNSWIEVLP